MYPCVLHFSWHHQRRQVCSQLCTVNQLSWFLLSISARSGDNIVIWLLCKCEFRNSNKKGDLLSWVIAYTGIISQTIHSRKLNCSHHAVAIKIDNCTDTWGGGAGWLGLSGEKEVTLVCRGVVCLPFVVWLVFFWGWGGICLGLGFFNSFSLKKKKQLNSYNFIGLINFY